MANMTSDPVALSEKELAKVRERQEINRDDLTDPLAVSQAHDIGELLATIESRDQHIKELEEGLRDQEPNVTGPFYREEKG